MRNGRRRSPIIAGASAGAINGAMIAASQRRLRSRHPAPGRALVGAVGRARLPLRRGLARLRRHALAARSRARRADRAAARSSRCSTPRRCARFIAAHLPLDGIAESIRDGHLYAVAVSATSYHSGKSFTFIQGRRRPPAVDEEPPRHPARSSSRSITSSPRRRSRSSSRRCSSAPEVGECYFGDGGLRLVTPFSPAIRLGATRIFADRHPLPELGRRAVARRAALGEESHGGLESIGRPPLAQICGVFLNAIFLDHLDTDLDHLRRMNELIGHATATATATPAAASGAAVSEPMRRIEPLRHQPVGGSGHRRRRLRAQDAARRPLRAWTASVRPTRRAPT